MEENKAKEDILKGPTANVSIEIKCRSCGKDFKIDLNVPISRQTFYCRCPNCKSEYKMGNPNYINT